MRLINRNHQSGSMLTFIIIGSILLAGLIGGTYFLKKHGEQVRQDKIIAAIKQQKNDKSETAKAASSNAVAVTDSESGSNILPETGIELNVIQLIGIYSLTASIFSYILSRRSLISHL